METPSTYDISLLEEETQHRYTFQRVLGRGAYGIVFAVTERETGKEFALKRFERIFESTLDAKRCIRELKILGYLKHENITNIHNVTTKPVYEDFNSIIVVMDLMETDMYQIIRSKQPLLVDHHRYFIYQLLRGLKYIHSAGIMHRDLKPANLLLNASCDLKIADFGLGRLANVPETEEMLSEYVATRWYRSPEVLLNYDSYGTPLDIWSVGCILAELIRRQALFPGKSPLDQLILIQKVLGSPSPQELRNCTNPKALQFMNSLPHCDPVPWEVLFEGYDTSPEEIDFLRRCLTWDPEQRITVDEALQHPFLESLHDPLDEPVTFPMADFEMDLSNKSMEELKRLLWEEILSYHPEFEN